MVGLTEGSVTRSIKGQNKEVKAGINTAKMDSTTKFESCQVSGIDLSELSTLAGVSFANSDLTSANFSGSNLTGATFGTKLSKTNFSNTQVSKVSFKGADLSGGVIFKGAKMVSMQGATMGANGTILMPNSTNFTSANLTSADFSDLAENSLMGVNFSSANLTGAKFTNYGGGGGNGLNFTGANLTKADLSGVQMQYFNFSKATLANANMQNSDFTKANFTQADLTGANADGTSSGTVRIPLGTYVTKRTSLFNNANFDSANLTSASFKYADFSSPGSGNKTNFNNAVTTKADFSYAKLYGASLGNSITNAKNTGLTCTLTIGVNGTYSILAHGAGGNSGSGVAKQTIGYNGKQKVVVDGTDKGGCEYSCQVPTSAKNTYYGSAGC